MMAAIILLDGFRRRKQRRQARVASQGSVIVSKKNVRNMKAGEMSKCRICLNNDLNAVYIPIFQDDFKGAIADDIRKFGEVEVSEGDNLPKVLCQSCHNLLQAAVQFRTQAQATDRRLRKAVQEKQSSSNDYESIHNDEMDWADDDKDEQTDEIKCKKCQLVFTTSKEFLEHVKSGLHKRARLPCPECKQSVAFRYLPVHMARFHDSVQPFICDVCGRSFPVKGSFKRHLMTHTDQLPFMCPECPYRGRFRESLKLHMRVHTGEKPYACDQCPAQFINASNLSKHKRTHRAPNFKCEQCDRGFYTQDILNEHLRVDHTGIKEHKCDMCGKEFAYRKQMMKHTRKVHQRPKQYYGRMPLYLQIEQRRQAENLESASTEHTDGHQP